MAAKRRPTSDLNHTNWNAEDAPEDAGTFKRATDDEIKTRVIKTAKRRNPIHPIKTDEEKKSIFGSFTGFSKAPPPTSNAFSFLSNLTKPEQPKTNGITEKNEPTVSTSNPLTSLASQTTKPTFTIPTNSQKPSADVNTPRQPNGKSNDYYAKLKGLNESVSKWIKQHVDENPFVNLQPIFKDYEKYLEELEADSGKKEVTNTTSVMNFKPLTEAKESVTSSSQAFASFVFKPAEKVPTSNNSTEKDKPTFSFGVTSTTESKDTTSKFGTTTKTNELSKESTNAPDKPKFSFGTENKAAVQSDEKKDDDKPKFSFGSSPASTSFKFGTGTSNFSFGSTANSSASTGFSFPKPSATVPGFTFSNVSKPESTENAQNDEDDEPPKVEFTPVVEEGHVYTTKCKVFVKKDKDFTDRGVGNLFLKPVPDSEKTQLIVRADTNLGNLLCNFILSESIPTQRMGKKDVMLVCLPTPDTKPPPVPVLLRVKSPEEADKLLETLTKYKK